MCLVFICLPYKLFGKKLLDFCALNLTIFLGKMELMIFEINCGPAKIGDIGRWA